MLKISHAACLGLPPAILTQFTLKLRRSPTSQKVH